jgi:Arc/MetJ family transcription regulator
MVKRTTINLDANLVSQAREVLLTGNTTDTVHGALRDVIRRDRLRRLAERDWDMTLEDLQQMRRSRVETRPWGRLDADFPELGPSAGTDSRGQSSAGTAPAGVVGDEPKKVA